METAVIPIAVFLYMIIAMPLRHFNRLQAVCNIFTKISIEMESNLLLLVHPHTHLVQSPVTPRKIRDRTHRHVLHPWSLLTVKVITSRVGEPFTSNIEKRHA